MLDRESATDDVLQRVAAATAGGVDWLQVRDRSLEGGELLAFTDAVRSAAPGARLVVNRRTDVALAADAAGVHLGFDAVDVGTARKLLGEEALVGVSCHSAQEVHGADAASYAQLAPIFSPLSKSADRTPLGLDALRAASGGIPVLAQGGIEASNAAACIEAGAEGVAVTGAIGLAADPAAAADALRRALDGVSP